MLMEIPVKRRRKHSPEFKASVVALCQPGVSTSAVALAAYCTDAEKGLS